MGCNRFDDFGCRRDDFDFRRSDHDFAPKMDAHRHFRSDEFYPRHMRHRGHDSRNCGGCRPYPYSVF